MARVAYLAENFGSLPSEFVSLETAMHLCGHNVGNFAFWNAARKLFDADITLFGFGSKTKGLTRKNVDFICIPAANFLNATANLDWLAKLIRELDKPCIVVGRGAPSARENTIPEQRPGTVQPDRLDHAADRAVSQPGPVRKRSAAPPEGAHGRRLVPARIRGRVCARRPEAVPKIERGDHR